MSTADTMTFNEKVQAAVDALENEPKAITDLMNVIASNNINIRKLTKSTNEAYQAIDEIIQNIKKPVDYSSSICPSTYYCQRCGATSVKLWRPYQSFNIRLLCAHCASEDQKQDITEMDDNGTIPVYEGRTRTDQIGWYIPAIPSEENDSYWGYTAVPVLAIEWWRRLPIGTKAQ